MKAYVCDICGTAITEPYLARMKEFCFTVSNSDIYQVPEPTKTKVKIHLCNDCFEGFKSIAKEKTLKSAELQKREAESV